MTHLKYFFAKLSCPNSNDENKFLSLFQDLRKFEKFHFNLENIPNNLETASPKDIIFIHIGGDFSNKRKYFKDHSNFIDYENGLHCTGIINKINSNNKEVSVTVIGLKEIVTKEDLYFFPQFINNLGASTKGTPNQAGLFELDETVALGLIEYLYKRELLSRNHDIFQNLEVKDKLFSKALFDYENNFKEKRLTQQIFQKYNNTDTEIRKEKNTDLLIQEFINWFNKPVNVKHSYKGIVNRENLSFWDSAYFNNDLFKIIGETKKEAFERIKVLVNNNQSDSWVDFNNSSSKGAPKAVLGSNNYLKFLEEYLEEYLFELNSEKNNFKINSFHDAAFEAYLKFSKPLISRYVSSLCTKPFVLLSGLSGSGKTKLAQSFAQWICEDDTQYKIVPVGADWTNREPLLGYPNALNPEEYVKPENGVLDLILEASKNENKPYFLILDEMNLSHVERYFADFLSAMESGDTIPLHSSEEEISGIPNKIQLPQNLFIVGTVNIDETTYMFSPKVLDRANAIEFRLDTEDIESYLESPRKIKLENLEGLGASMAESFVALSQEEFDNKSNEELNKVLIPFFNELKKSGAEFGYRTAGEIHRLYNQLEAVNSDLKQGEKIDITIMQKLLPKLHGSQRKLKPVLNTLGSFCLVEGVKVQEDIFDSKVDIDFKNDERIKFRLSLEKITRMYKSSVENGFASYAEA